MQASLLTSFFSIWREDKNHRKLQISFKGFEELKIAIFTYTCSTHSSLHGFSSLPFDPDNSSLRRFKEFSIAEASRIPSQWGTHEALPLTEELLAVDSCQGRKNHSWGVWPLVVTHASMEGPPPMHPWAALKGLNELLNNNKKNNNKKTWSWEMDLGEYLGKVEGIKWGWLWTCIVTVIFG